MKETVDEGDVIPIGRPYRDYRVFLLNEDGTAVPDGEEGEICVSGPILASDITTTPSARQRIHPKSAEFRLP